MADEPKFGDTVAWNTRVENAAAGASLYMYGMTEVENAKAFQTLKQATHVELLEFPLEVTDRLAELTREVMAEEAAKDADFARLLNSYEAFRALHADFEAVTETSYRKALQHAAR